MNDRFGRSIGNCSDEEHNELLKDGEVRGRERDVVENPYHINGPNNDSNDSHPTDTFRFFRCAHEDPADFGLFSSRLIGISWVVRGIIAHR